MANFVKSNAQYISVDTTAGNDSITLAEIAGKEYYIANVGSGGNLLTVNYGVSSVNLGDFEATTFLYDGSDWVVGNVVASGGDIRYSPTASYVTGQVVWYVDSFYEALQDSTGQQPDISPLFWKQIVSSPGVTWSDEATYSIGDWAQYQNRWFESLVDDNIANTPPSSDTSDANWTFKANSNDIEENKANIVQGVNYTNRTFVWDISGYNTYKDAAQDTPEDGTGGTPLFVTLEENTLTPFIGDTSLRMTTAAGDAQGEGFSYNFSIDLGQTNKAMEFSFIYGNGSNDGDIRFFIYDVDNSNLIPTSVSELSSTGALATPGQFFCTWNATSSLNYRAIWHVATSSSPDLVVDNIQVGPFNTAIGLAGSSGRIYPPGLSYNGLGTVTNNNLYWSRVGEKLFVEGELTTGVVTGSQGVIPLPPGLTSKRGIREVVGHWASSAGGNPEAKSGPIIITSTSSQTYVELSFAEFNDNTNPFSTVAANAIFSNTQLVGIKFSVAIAQWGVNIGIIENQDDFVSNSNTTDANEVAFVPANNVLGSAGSLIPNMAAATGVHQRWVQYSGGFSPTDDFQLEVRGPDESWIDIIPRLGAANRENTYFYGTRIIPQDDYKTVLIFFLRGGYENTAATYGTVGANPWSELFTAGWLWRLRRIPNGKLSQIPPLVSAEYHSFTSQTSGQPLIFTTRVRDTHFAYSTTTGLFTAPLSGLYRLGVNVILPSATANYEWDLWKNGIVDSLIDQRQGVGTNLGIGLPSKGIYLLAGETTSIRPNFSNAIPGGSIYRIQITRLGN